MNLKNRYEKAKIYTIRSYNSKSYYIGSTCCEVLAKRLYEHKSAFNLYTKDQVNNKRKYRTSFQILEHGNYYIELLENYPCSSKDELHKREGELIRKHINDVVNKNIPTGTQRTPEKNREYAKEYYKKNKDTILQKQKKRRAGKRKDKKTAPPKHAKKIILPKKKTSEKQLAHLARMRKIKAEKAKLSHPRDE